MSDFRTKYRGAQCRPMPSVTDISTLANHGANLIRFQVTGAHAQNYTAEQWKAWVRDFLAHIDFLTPTFLQYKLRIIFDIHTPPGGFDAQGKAVLFSNPEMRSALVQMWHEIAARYKGSSAIYAYDLLNEPAGTVAQVNDLFADILTVIRLVDTQKRCIISSPFGDITKLPKLTWFQDKKLWYTFHMYYPTRVAAQGLDNRPYPVAYPTTGANKEKLREHLLPAIKVQNVRNVQMYVGEFSITSFANDADAGRFLKDYISLYEQYGFNWTYHAWRESPVWDAERSPLTLKPLVDGWKKN